jgi:hypothetical protein
MGWVRRQLFRLAAEALTKPRGSYELLQPNDLEHLRRTIRKGDVILVDGDQRVSEVIKYLTQSMWSHAALYVGDELLRRHPSQREELVAEHGTDAEHLLVEALMESGVIASPISKYEHFNVRVCRPHGIAAEHTVRVLDEVLAQLGFEYDVKNVLDLARFFFPVSLIPRRFRRRALDFGSGITKEVICSSMIARAFQNVGFPILPKILPGEPDREERRFLQLVRRDRGHYPTIFRRRNPRVVTPRDFDLSPYFDIVKFNAIRAERFDYRRIRWEDEDEPPQRKGVS